MTKRWILLYLAISFAILAYSVTTEGFSPAYGHVPESSEYIRKAISEGQYVPIHELKPPIVPDKEVFYWNRAFYVLIRNSSILLIFFLVVDKVVAIGKSRPRRFR